MRMWGVEPHVMCRQHLLGEHVEMHMLMGTLAKGISVAGYIRDGLVDVRRIAERHDQLVAEMHTRGFNHRSTAVPDATLSALIARYQDNPGRVDTEANLSELVRRCPACAVRILEAF